MQCHHSHLACYCYQNNQPRPQMVKDYCRDVPWSFDHHHHKLQNKMTNFSMSSTHHLLQIHIRHFPAILQRHHASSDTQQNCHLFSSGQALVLQLCWWIEFPSQSASPPEGGGLSQDRSLIRIPPPHVAEQLDQLPNAPHWSSTINMHVNYKHTRQELEITIMNCLQRKMSHCTNLGPKIFHCLTQIAQYAMFTVDWATAKIQSVKIQKFAVEKPIFSEVFASIYNFSLSWKDAHHHCGYHKKMEVLMHLLSKIWKYYDFDN